MLSKTIAKLLCSGTCACLLWAFLLQNYFSINGEDVTENLEINENMMRPEITTPQGKIRGINMATRYNRRIFGFVGIPYAQPPVGELRFRPPQPAQPWKGTLDASTDTEPCPQFNDEGEISGVEDCLHLNVFTPQLPASDDTPLLPVMMYVIGGGFKTGNNSVERFVPDFILDKDVLLVFPNFRVGVIGFLSTGDEVVPGNNGLKDIVQSLKWIQNNIRYFGGDPNRVTILGGSSGAISVHLLTLSPLTDGLIHRYITQSGSGLSNTAVTPRELIANRTIQLGRHLGCPTETSILLVNCLRGLNVSQLVDTNSLFYAWGTIPQNVWMPTEEPDIEGALLSDTPANLVAAGKIRDLPSIACVTRDEGLVASLPFYENPTAFDNLLENIDVVLSHIFTAHNAGTDIAPLINTAKSYYLNNLTADRSVLLANFTDLTGDGIFIHPTYRMIKQQLALAKSPVFFCSFEYEGVFSHGYLFSGGSNKYKGVAHGNELLYLFGHQKDRLGPPGSEFSETDLVMVDKMVQLWTSFAINGYPSIEDSNNVVWEPFSSLNNYLQIGNGPDTTLEVKYNLRLERMQFWEELTASTAT